jgi:proton-dependent oligopeptide transporter, POT family
VAENYMQNSINDHLHPGALGLGQAIATNLSYFFSFVIYLTPIGGALIADNWLNRYRTLWISFMYVLKKRTKKNLIC